MEGPKIQLGSRLFSISPSRHNSASNQHTTPGTLYASYEQSVAANSTNPISSTPLVPRGNIRSIDPDRFGHQQHAESSVIPTLDLTSLFDCYSGPSPLSVSPHTAKRMLERKISAPQRLQAQMDKDMSRSLSHRLIIGSTSLASLPGNPFYAYPVERMYIDQFRHSTSFTGREQR